ncbi:MAG: hypothetical protein Q9163_004079 [Psora crenata]
MPYLHPQDPGTTGSAGEDRNAVAVIGLACRFPGDATSADRFWEFLCNSRSAYSEPERFNVNAFHSARRGRLNTSATRGAHFLRQDIAAFDANFFSISQNEALAMDPQQRLMLEIAYEAFENAGLPLEAIAGTDTSCYVGNFTTDYREMIFRDLESAPLYSISGTGSELISNRLSWFYDLRGPSFTLGTACSSSLVALHQACQSIRTGESKMALVGGSNLMLNPDMFLVLSNQQFLSQDGRCKSFDARGDGYGRGEGFAAVILKPVEDAVRDGDPIRAVIRGTGVNQDGKTKGITVPNSDAQADLIRATYRSAGIDFRDTHYFEAHGTGTRAGDPLELEAISKTLGSVREAHNKIIVGSVKSNIGHLEATAGLAGLIKAIYILENATIPPNINFQQANPRIPFEEWKITVPTKVTPWPTNGLRRVSVQGFGYGGTNAHAILDDAFHYLAERKLKGIHFTKSPDPPLLTYDRMRNPVNPSSNSPSFGLGGSTKKPRLFVLSAQDRDGLNRQRRTLHQFLRDQSLQFTGAPEASDLYLGDLAFTLSERRSRLAWRSFVTASSTDELLSGLESTNAAVESFRPSSEPRIGFVFTGQGAQWPRMGVELYQYPVFRESIEEADEYLRFELGCKWSAVEEMHRDDSQSNIHLPEYSQPLCTVLQIALVDLLASWNILPCAMTGHSSGEIAGAYCLGALSKQDALKIAFYRGLLSSEIKKLAPNLQGSMMAVGASEDEAQTWIDRLSCGEVVVACINSPSSVTLSGDASAIDELQIMLQQEGVFARKLRVENAYHSPHMDTISVPYLEAMQGIQTQAGWKSRKMYSAVTGGFIEASELGPMNWVRNLVSPVLFYDALYEILRPTQRGSRCTENNVDILLEIGPHSALQGAMNQTMKKHGIKGVDCRSVLSRGRHGIQTALAAAGALAAQGAGVDISKANNDTICRPLADLPSYSWNHSRTYWAESRVSKEYRFRKHPRSSLLGAPCPTMGESEWLWRGFLRTSEEPWIREHKIQSSILYPAAGYIAMAIEGGRQIAAQGQVIKSFKFRDIQIVAPAVVTEDSDLECILQLRPHRASTRDSSSTWTEFSVSSCAIGQGLRQNCYGLFLIEYESADRTGMAWERELEDQAAMTLYNETKVLCGTTEDAKDFYEELASFGLNYGDSFQNLSDIHRGHGRSCCAVEISDASSPIMSGQADRPHIIHPTTLDAMFHAVFAAYKDQKGHLKEAMVPTSIDEMTIAANIPSDAGTGFRGCSKARKHGFRELMAELVMLDQHLTAPAVTVKGFRCAAISTASGVGDEETEQAAKKMFTKILWKPVLGLSSPDRERAVIDTATPAVLTPGSAARLEKLEMLAFYYIRQALRQVSTDMVEPRFQGFYGWMRDQEAVGRTHSHDLPTLGRDWFDVDEEAANLMQEELGGGAADGLGLCQIGKNLERILCGHADVARLLAENSLIDRYFHELQGMDECRRKLAELVDLAAHTNPDISILELGDAEGGAASSILNSKLGNSSAMDQAFPYTFTTANGAALEAAQASLQPLKDRIGFKVLSIQEELSTQGFEASAFDIIIISHPLAALQLEGALTNIRKLLKQGGTLCLLNVNKPGLRLSIVLNCLPDSLRYRKAPRLYLYSTNVSSHEKNGRPIKHMDNKSIMTILKGNDFNPKFAASDFEDARYQQLSLVVATAKTAPETELQGQEIIVLEAPNPSQKSCALAAKVVYELNSRAIRTSRITWSKNISNLQGKICVSLMELEESFLKELGEPDFAATKQLILQASSLLWITALDDPEGSLASGMARSIRNEIPGKVFRTLQVGARSLDMPDRLAPLLGTLAVTSTADDEFLEEDGILKVPRVVEDEAMNQEMAHLLAEGKENIELIPLDQVPYPQKLGIRAQGMLDTLCLEADDTAGEELANDEVEIKVRATGLNFRDVMVALGQIPDSLLGFEASGTISRVGRDVTHFKIGDSVCTLSHGAHRTLLRSKACLCQSVPSNTSFEEAATLPLVHCTAFYALVHVARVRPGQTVLIHAAAGGVGQAAIQLARHFDLEIFATVGSVDKRQLIQATYGVPDDHIFNSRDLSFAKGIMRMTNGRGVDCIINSLSGEALRQTWSCIAPFGTFVEIGMKDILSNTGLDMRPFLQDATFTFFNLNHVMSENPRLMTDIMEGTFGFLRKGIIRPVSPVTTYSISDVESAFRLMQTGKHRGKIAIRWDSEHAVPVLRHASKSFQLDGNASYVLVGGLGGLGRSLANLLVDLGARHLCFISRSGAKSEGAQRLIHDLEKKQIQCSVHCCDVADTDQLAYTLSECSCSVPPIRGVFQCAMALQDTLFEKMTYNQWIDSLRPKVQGSWNLHTHLPRNLDFFITLSSFAGVFGNRSQSNYAAAGAYQDALAFYRRSRGLKAVTIDLGIMREVGVIAEQGATDYLKEWEEPFGIRESEFHHMVKYIIGHELATPTPARGGIPAQILTGFATGGAAHRAGIRRPFYFDDPRFAILAKADISGKPDGSSSDSSTNGTIPLREQISHCTMVEDAARAVTDALVGRVAKTLQTELSEIDENRPLHSYGVDSLVAVEVANWIFKEVKVSVSVFDILASMPITALAAKVVVQSPHLSAELVAAGKQ